MAYQPIQMADHKPIVAEAMFKAREQTLQKEQQRAQALRDQWDKTREEGAAKRQQQQLDQNEKHQQFIEGRQQVADQEGVQKEIQRLHDAGLGHQAQQFAKLHGLTATAQGSDMLAPLAPEMPQEPTMPDAPEEGPILPQQLAPQGGQYQAPRGAGLDGFDPNAAANRLGSVGQGHLPPESVANMQRMQAERDAVQAFPAKQEEYGRQMTEVFPQQQAEYEAKQAAFDQRGANPLMAYAGPNGQSFSVDPLEARRAQVAKNQERADMLRQAFGGMPEMKQYVDPSAAFVQAGEDIKPSDVFGMAKNDAAARLKREEDAAAASKVQWEHDHKGEISDTALDQQRQLARIRASASAAAAAPGRADTTNRQDLGALRQEEKAWVSQNQLNVDAKSAKRLHTIMSNLNSGNAMQQREAAESMVSVFKGGGQVTKASQDLLLKHLAGIVGDAETYLQHMDSGHFGGRELQVLQQAGEAAIKEQEELAQNYYQSYVDKFGPGSGWEGLAGNVNHNAKSYFRQYGLDVPDVYAGEAPSVVLGSGKRPKASGAPAPAKSLQVGGKVVHYDAQGKRLP